METTLRTISKCTIKPASPSGGARCYLSAWDLAMLSARYIQKGLLFHRPPLPVPAIADGVIREGLTRWLEAPMMYWLSGFDVHSIMVGSSPRFDMYGCEFGWGRAVAARSGSANKFDGKVSAYSGREGGGSVVLEICLKPEYMAAFEADPEFISAVSVSGDV